MAQSDINTEFSGNIASIQQQLADISQQLLLRPNQTTYGLLATSLETSISNLTSTNTDLTSKYNTLQNLYVALRMTQNNRYTEYTGFTGSVTGSIWAISGLAYTLTGNLYNLSGLYTGHTGLNSRAAHPAPILSIGYKLTGVYTLSATEDVVFFSGDALLGSSGTLPSATSLSGRIFSFKRLDSNPTEVCLTGFSSSQTIDGELKVLFTSQYTGLTILSDGNNWLKIF